MTSLPAGLRLFYDLVHRLNSSLDLHVVLAQVIEQVNAFLDIDATSVSLLDSGSQELIIQMTIGQATDPQPGLRLPPRAGIAGWVASHGQAVLIGDAQQDGRFYPAVDQLTSFTTRAVICVPLLSKDRPLGVIEAMSRKAGTFSNADLCFLETLADVASLAIENARLYEAEQMARRQAVALRNIAETISSSLCVEDVLSLALAELRQVVAYDAIAVLVLREYSSLLLSDPVGSDPVTLDLLAVCGPEPVEAAVGRAVSGGDVMLLPEMLAHRQPIAASDLAPGEWCAPWAPTRSVRSWLGIPLIAGGKVFGQISIERHSPQDYTPQETETALAFGHQAATAITNARLYREACSRSNRPLPTSPVCPGRS